MLLYGELLSSAFVNTGYVYDSSCELLFFQVLSSITRTIRKLEGSKMK